MQRIMRITTIRLLVLFAFLLTGTAALAAGNKKITYIHFDASGSPVAGTDEQGNVVWVQTYGPYGKRTQVPSAADGNTTTRSYTSHVEDAETGLLYMQGRYYDPVT